jgi:glycosyltransferase involved in cell wall biosynthesis
VDQAVTTPSKNTAPFVSVLMSCYNASRWLEESIQSVLNQSYGDFEFIIVDDGSEDDTLSIVRRYASKDDRIIVITKPNTGLADSLNVGIKQARGKWIARLDADDVSEQTRLEKQVRFVMTKPNLVFVGTGLTEVDENGRKLSTHRYPLVHRQLVRHLVTAQKFPPHSSALYRAKAVRSVSGYRTRIRRSQDRDLWLRLSEIGELACLDEPLVKVRKHADQISHEESGRRQLIDSRMAISSYWFRQKKEEDPVSLDEATFNAFYVWLEKELMDDGLFEFQSYKRHLKMLLKCRVGRDSDWLRAGSVFMAHPAFSLRILRERIWGESMPARLVGKWIKAQKSFQAK